jgi:hypothetical protein
VPDSSLPEAERFSASIVESALASMAAPLLTHLLFFKSIETPHKALQRTRAVTNTSPSAELADYLYQGDDVAKPATGSMLTQFKADHERLALITEEGRFNRSAQFRNDNSKATACVSGKLLQALPGLILADGDDTLMPL